MEGVVELKDISLVYGSVASITVVVNVELVAGTFTAYTYTLASTGGATVRSTKTIPLDGLYGKQVQVRVASSGAFTLFSGELRVRPIGVYMDGANSEIWQSQPMSLGV